MQVIDLNSKLEYNILADSKGENQQICPVCSHTRKKKSVKCFSYNREKAAGKCGHCGVVLVEKREMAPKRQEIEFKRPSSTNQTQLSSQLLTWFKGRGIGQQTIVDFKIGEGMEWMPQTGKEENTVQFKYFRNGELINIKYRTGKKDFKMFKGAEMIFYNLDATINHTEIIIVEGEMDVLAMHEAGYRNVISVPNGCTDKGKINLDYLDNCIDSFSDDTKIILALDNDKVGNRLKEELARRFGFENCFVVTFKDCKDANDCLIKYGKDVIKECIDAKEAYPIEGIFTANDIRAEILNYYQNGMPTGYGVGIGELDEHIKFQPGYLTVIGGIPGHGKSEFVDFLMTRLNISHGLKAALFSPENHPMELHFSKYAEKLVGKSFDSRYDKMTPIDLDSAMEYFSKNFYFINPEVNFDLDSILSKAKALIRTKGITNLVIDAWNKLDHKYTGNETKYISEQLDKIVDFCRRSQVHCFLVVHPTKMQKDRNTGKYEVPTLYHMAGSNTFFSKTANGITVYRDYDSGTSEIHVQKVKFKHWGKDGLVELAWDRINGRYYKGNPNYDNWISVQQNAPTSQINNNEDFLEQSSVIESTDKGIVMNSDKILPF